MDCFIYHLEKFKLLFSYVLCSNQPGNNYSKHLRKLLCLLIICYALPPLSGKTLVYTSRNVHVHL